MNDATFEKLEFHLIREALAGYCSCGLGKKLAHGLNPSTNTKLIRQWMAQVREMAEVAITHSLPPMGGIHDITEAIRASGLPAPLEPNVLGDVAETLAATGTLHVWFGKIGDTAPQLGHLRDRITDLSPMATVINDAIDSRGHVRDYASPKLASIRRTIEDARAQIKIVFDRILRQTGIAKILQYAGATFHNDRGVLPLKAEHRGRIPGIIHRSSDSGATLFVEPSASVGLNNSLVRLREDEEKEITRILVELTRHLHAAAENILRTIRAIGALDLIAAKCRYAKARNCVCPEIDDRGILDVHDARHPILIEIFAARAASGKKLEVVVPIDARLGDDFDVMMITGPNTGGKTVAIKTVGLLALMTQCGIPIPVGPGSRMPVFGQIYVDIGDEQSLQQSLSTFSSHLSNLLDILEHAGPRTLVLIDELGAGTDPDEGAAIGSAIVAELLKRGARALITTHLSVLKALAYTTDRVDNASVEFDPVSLKPTYHLRMGEPGNSNALIIAERLGMSKRLIAHAKSRLDEREGTLKKAIAGTLASRREAEEARKTARAAALESQREQEAYEERRQALERETARYERWTKWVNALAPGDAVYLRKMKRPAKVVRMQLHKQVALVSSGTIDIEVPLRDIAEPREG